MAPVAEPPKVKKPKFALTRKQLHAAEAAAAAGTAAAAAAPAQSAAPAPVAAAAPAAPAPPKVKKPKFALTRKQLHAAEAAAAGTAAAGAAVAAAPAPPQPAPAAAPPKVKKPKFALTRKQLHAAEAAAAGTAVAAAPTAAPAPPKAKKPKFALTRKQLHAAEAAAAATAAAAAVAPTAPPADPVALAFQPPPPGMDQTPMAAPPTEAIQPSAFQSVVSAPSGDPTDAPGAADIVFASTGAKSSRRTVVLLVVLLVVVVAAGAGYLITKKNNTTTAPPVAPIPGATTATALAASINLRLTDLPAGWTQSPPAQAVVRPPVAPAAAQAAATNAMASCLSSSYAVVSGLFGSGSLPGQTSLVQSPMFQSGAGSSFQMASRTTALASAGQVQALDAVFTNPKFDSCYTQYQSSLVQAAAPGATASVQPVTLTSPTGVQSYGMVTTYTVPNAGTEVVGDAYLLGGRVVSVIQPSTNGAAIPASVFAPAFNAVASRVAASAS